MTQQQEHILNKVREGGGRINWGWLIDEVPYADRQRALSDVRVLETEGKVRREVAPDNETGAITLTIELVGA